jgi:membrane-associated phospholipid phosphatase
LKKKSGSKLPHAIRSDLQGEISHKLRGSQGKLCGIIGDLTLWGGGLQAGGFGALALGIRGAAQLLVFVRQEGMGLGLKIGSAALAYGIGCGKHHSYLRDTGFKTLAAMGAAGTVDFGLKLAFDRQFPYTRNSTGKFWGGGRSFPSGHSATSFAFAAVVAHRYPKNKSVKWGAYALATGVSLSRYPAKKHYPLDILIGESLGYVTGTYLSEH